MTYSISQPYFAFSDDSAVNCIWDHPVFGPIPFMATPTDVEPYGVQIYNDLLSGEYGPIVSYLDSHWYSIIDGNEWEGKIYKFGQLMISPLGIQPPNSTNQPIPAPPSENNASIN
jgi:hypothetical protein